jgi:hypothetical protein
MYNAAIKRVDEHVASAPSPTRESLERWRSLAERSRAVVEEAVSLIERLYVGEYKGGLTKTYTSVKWCTWEMGE